MASDLDPPQRIARLTPLDDVLARIDALPAPLEPRQMALRFALNRVLAQDAVVGGDLPASARALRDGFALRSDATADAGAYAPSPLAAPPVRVDVGDPLPGDADAVAPLDAVVEKAGRWQALAPVIPGEGVLTAGADLRANTVLRRAGERLRASDLAVLAACGIAEVKVRMPCVRLVRTRPGHDGILEAAVRLVASGVEAAGGWVASEGAASTDDYLEDASADRPPDVVFAFGGTGSGRRDAAVRTLARVGRVEAHGVALSPGETAAFGCVGQRPVLLIPGRVDAAFAVWLVLGRRILARLAGASEEARVIKAELSRKVASPLGLAEVVPVRIRDGAADPIASGYVPLSALAQADGWIFVRPESEGYPARSEVVVRPWP